MAGSAHRVTVLAAILAAGMALPVRADPVDRGKDLRSEGCVAIGTHQIAAGGFRPWDCRFTATGPAAFIADTPGPFVISISKDEGRTWNDVIRRTTVGPPTAGQVPSVTGDLVAISISCWDYTTGSYCLDGIGGRYGVVAAHSRL